jgi:hypothetical protein
LLVLGCLSPTQVSRRVSKAFQWQNVGSFEEFLNLQSFRKGHSIHDEDLIVSDKIHQHWKNEEVKPCKFSEDRIDFIWILSVTEALIAKFMQDVEGATQSNKKVSQNVANSISAIAAVVLEDKQATATANKYKVRVAETIHNMSDS